ncbi:helix-turn-helix domain-containing protein [Ekhidna sp.]
MNDLDKRVKEARKAKGLSQEALANQSNISLRTIQRIEKGVIPRDSTLAILCEVLGLDFNDFTNQISETIEGETRTIRRMNLSIMLLMIVPLASIIIPLLIWKSSKKLNELNSLAGKIVSFQIIWTLAALFIFFLAVFSSNLITGTAGEGHYWAFITLAICMIWNIIFVVYSTNVLNTKRTDFLKNTPNFF